MATFLPLNYHWSTLLHMEVVKSVTLLLHFFMLILHCVGGFLEVSTLFDTSLNKEVPLSVGTSNTLHYPFIKNFRAVLTIQYKEVSRSVFIASTLLHF